ncbi:MAG: hypothetical protein AMXMBFR12_06830 [Candidatus Babeliales bacterium]
MKHIVLSALLILPSCIFALNNPVYVCTAADEHYFHCLVNLIGSLHKHNFADIEEIAVFNLGLNNQQIAYLNTIEKIQIYSIEITHPDLLKRFNTRHWGKPIPGWYAWKPVIIKQAFDFFPSDSNIFWMDAGTTILKSLIHLFEYTEEKGYFFHNGCDWLINKETTNFVKEKFDLHSSENSWIKSCVGMEAGFMGVTKRIYNQFIFPMYILSYDMRYFTDDGSCPEGFGYCRHDQALFSLFALINNMTIFHHYASIKDVFYLEIKGEKFPFHIACVPEARIDETNVYRARFDVNPNDYIPFIHWRQK